jgi:hypothetical protein
MPPVKSGWPIEELHHKIFLSEKSSMTPRVIELGRLRELTLKGSLSSPTSLPRKCTSICNFGMPELLQISIRDTCNQGSLAISWRYTQFYI